jgi:hypothetical protein
MSTTRPLACDSAAIPVVNRQAHFELIQRLFGNLALGRASVPGGYRFRFDAEALGQIADFVENERKCCPFLAFLIAVDGDADWIWLQLTGPAGTREFLDTELPWRESSRE